MNDDRGPATFSQHALTGLANAGWRWTEGYSLAFMGEIIRTHGFLRFTSWFGSMGKVIAGLEARYGAADTQMLAAFSAFWVGCRYCSRGHLEAANLLRFRDEGVLFPIDGTILLGLQALDDEQVLDALRGHLEGRFDRQLALLERLFVLRAELETDATEEDPHLRAVLSMWAVLTDCSIMYEGEEVSAMHASVSTDALLHARYREAREQERRITSRHSGKSDAGNQSTET